MNIYDKISNSPFYPGSIWVKRWARLTVVFAIGLNVFINDFQDYTLRLIDEQSHEVARITEQIDLEKLRLKKIENGSWTAYSMDWLSVFIDSPKANEVNRVIELAMRHLTMWRLLILALET